MKKKLFGTMMIFVIIGGLSGCSSGNQTVASYEGGRLTQEKFYERLKNAYGKNLLQSILITDVLEKYYGDEVTKEDIDKSYQDWIDKYGSESTLETTYKNSGYTKDTFKDNFLRTDLLYSRAIAKEAKFTDEMYQEKWENSINFNVISVKDKAKAESLLKDLNDGKKFADLAKASSTDTTAKSGGKVGWYDSTKSTTYKAAVIEAAKKLNDGEHSKEVLDVEGTYYLLEMKVNPNLTKETWKENKSGLKEQLITSYKNDNTKLKALIAKDLKRANVKIKDSDLQTALADYLSTTNSSSSNSGSSSSNANSTNSSGTASSTTASSK